MVNKPLWVRWYPKDALDGMNVLTVAEECAYRRILDMIFATFDQLPDDDRALCLSTKLGRQWKAAKLRLIELGKIRVENGFIRNGRATKCCIESASFIAQKSVAGRASAECRLDADKTLKEHNTGSTDVAPPLQRNGNGDPNGEATNYNYNYISKKEPPYPPNAGDPQPRQEALALLAADGCQVLDFPVERRGAQQSAETAKPKPAKKSPTELPDWLPRAEWQAFVEMRKKIRKPLTEHAEKLLIKKLDEFRNQGFSVIEVMNQTIMNSWLGFFPPKPGQKKTQDEVEWVKGPFGEMVRKSNIPGGL